MSVDFQQLQPQVRHMGEIAQQREGHLRTVRRKAYGLLREHAQHQAALRDKVLRVVRLHDPNLRCALPTAEAMDLSSLPPPAPPNATIIAADGSQINPDRHAEVNYSLVNVGAIRMDLAAPDPPSIYIHSELLYDEKLYQDTGILTDSMLALMRDLNERRTLLDLAKAATSQPVITFADGPLELWGAKDPESASEFQKKLQAYLQVLAQLEALGVVTAGYVDKPGANFVVRLLEVAIIPEGELPDIRNTHPLHRATDLDLFGEHLPPGHRSAVFGMQSQSASKYRNALGLHFFYLNVGRAGYPDLARVEIPAWVADDPGKLDALHAVLCQQCQILGTRAYPYLLHRAHEAAVVTRDEKHHLTQMIVMEFRRRGIPVGRISPKQSLKELTGRPRR